MISFLSGEIRNIFTEKSILEIITQDKNFWKLKTFVFKCSPSYPQQTTNLLALLNTTQNNRLPTNLYYVGYDYHRMWTSFFFPPPHHAAAFQLPKCLYA